MKGLNTAFVPYIHNGLCEHTGKVQQRDVIVIQLTKTDWFKYNGFYLPTQELWLWVITKHMDKWSHIHFIDIISLF